ncbi:hypothetical protein ACU8DI_08930 [Psychroserpens sp. BH13MA-6]
MKRISLLIVLFGLGLMLNAQEDKDKNNASFKLGSGLNFSFNEGNYQFNFSGFIQPAYEYSKFEDMDTENQFSSKRSFLILSGKAVKEKVSFLVQTDYSLDEPLLDAWVAYHPINAVTITVGQKQTFVNNKEMTFREDRLQFTNKSRLSTNLSDLGREFGIFAEAKFNVLGNVGIAPMMALTSGDGRNSFGADSRDVDLGGLKIGGRLDVYPLGFFKEGNDLFSADLARETSPKFVIGTAMSKNSGVSNSVGDGHGDFFLYDRDGNISLPDYTQLYVDLLFKYKGFSLLAEYANAAASNLDEVYIDEAATTILAPQQISEYLYLGDAINIQGGYVLPKGLSFDIRYGSLKSEFSENLNSQLMDNSSYTFGLTKYFDNHNLKMQASITKINFENTNDQIVGEFLVQIVF